MARFDPDHIAIDELLTGPGGPVLQHVRRFAEDVALKAREHAPAEGGLLRESIEISDERIEPGRSIKLKVGADPIDPHNGFGYGLVAHEGHGIIHAGPGRDMAFFWAGQGRYVDDFREIRPTSGTPFLTDALKEVNATHGELFLLEPGEHEGPIG